MLGKITSTQVSKSKINKALLQTLTFLNSIVLVKSSAEAGDSRKDHALCGIEIILTLSGVEVCLHVKGGNRFRVNSGL